MKRTLATLLVLSAIGRVAAAPVSVRYAEGVAHGFLTLRTVDGVLIANGDLLQVAQDSAVEKRMVFHFKDGSSFEEKTVFTEQQVYALRGYSLTQRGPAFSQDVEIALERAAGKYRVKTKDHTGGEEKLLEGTLELPADVYNGMILTIVKDLPTGAGETIHYVAFTPEPRLIQLEIVPEGEHKVLIGDLAKSAVHYVLKPRLGIWLKLFATVLRRVPPDDHAWIVMDGVPAFARFEGPLAVAGPVWRIELVSPRWPE